MNRRKFLSGVASAAILPKIGVSAALLLKAMSKANLKESQHA